MQKISRRTVRFRCGIAAGVALLGTVSFAPTRAFGQDVPERGALEVTSALGRRLYALPDDPKLIAARTALAAEPGSVELALKLSKAQAARRQYQEAVATDTAALALAPKSAELYLERGHRRLGLREFAAAKEDLVRATELDAKMLDAQYHLGMAHYMLGEFDEAAEAFDKARGLATDDDNLIDCSNWLYVSLRRAGKVPKAEEMLLRITPAVKNTEAHLYFYLRLLHFYQGELTAADIEPMKPLPEDTEGELSFNTLSYGVGNWYLYHQEPAKARALFQEVVTGEAWNSWGFIGSELELAHKASGSHTHRRRHR